MIPQPSILPLNPGTIGQAGIAAATINSLNTKNIFFVGLVIAASGLISTPLALLAGLIYGLSFPHPYDWTGRHRCGDNKFFEHQEHLLRRPGYSCQWPHFDSLGAAGRAHLRPVVPAPLSHRRPETFRLPLEGIHRWPRFWNEPARGRAGGPERLPLHRAQHKFCHAPRSRDWTLA